MQLRNKEDSAFSAEFFIGGKRQRIVFRRPDFFKKQFA